LNWFIAERFAMKILWIVLLAAMVVLQQTRPVAASTGCGKHTDDLFNSASSAYTVGNWALTSANMQEAADAYARCARRAMSVANIPRADRFWYFYGASLYVAGEAEAKLNHPAKVKEFWTAGLHALRSVRTSKYLDDSQHALARHAITVMAATLKALR
jgi:hypothetical protein